MWTTDVPAEPAARDRPLSLRRRTLPLAVVWLALWCGLPAHSAGGQTDAAGDALLLDVDIVVLDPGLPADRARQRELGMFPSVRGVESRYFAVGLRRVLTESARWGAVRVVPTPDASAELTLSGTIERSDGRVVSLGLTASDSIGRSWIDASYSLSTPPSGDFDTARRAPAADPIVPLYRRVLQDLIGVLDGLSEDDLVRIREVSVLRYAAELAPERFSDYLAPADDELLVPVRLPARDDPMIARIRRVRLTDLQLKDTVDQLYGRSYDEIQPAYQLWREYSAMQTDYAEGRESQLLAEDRIPRKSTSYAGFKQSYENYRWSKLQEQTLRRYAARFDNEVSPTVQDVEGTVVELTGSIESQYAKWREILRSIFELENTTVPPAD